MRVLVIEDDGEPAAHVVAVQHRQVRAGILMLTAAGTIAPGADVVAVLTGNVLKDPDYIYRYHTGQLQAPGDCLIHPNFGNRPVVVPNDADRITELIR